MIQLKTKLRKFEVPSSYADVTIEDLEFLKQNVNDQMAIAERLIKVPADELVNMDMSLIQDVLGFLNVSILDSVDERDIIRIGKKSYVLPEDFTQCTWAQKIIASDAIKNSNLQRLLSVYLQPVYDGSDFSNDSLNRLPEIEKHFQKLSVEEVYGCIKFLMNQFIERGKLEEKLLKPNVTIDHQRAGIAMFNVLGDFNTIDEIAGGDVLKHDAVLMLDYTTIFNKLLKNNLTTKFEKNYSDILNKKK